MGSANQPPVLLLDGNAMASLAIARSLGSAGVRITVADSSPNAPTRYSRYVDGFLLYPSPLERVDEFHEWLVRQVATRKYGVLLGATDFTVPLLSQWRSELCDYVQVPLPTPTALQLASNKAATFEAAHRLGIPVPATVIPQNWAMVEDAARKWQWPIVIKPRSSVESGAGSRMVRSVEYAFDKEELRRRIATLISDSPWPLLQEYVRGIGVGCFFLIKDGKVLARFQHRRLRDINPTGSGSSLRVSVPPDPELMEMSERMLRAIGLDGLSMVEYRLAAGHTSYLMEINARPWGSMQLAVEAGVDFPMLWYRAITGQPAGETAVYQCGVQCRYVAGDLRHLESVLMGAPRGWRLDYPKRLPTILQFLRFWGKNLHYDDFAAGDWRPGWRGIRNYLRGLGTRIAKKIASSWSTSSERT
jgi:predicted ATP-grasp superfamily ATP-dependent carboligase